MSVVQKLKDKTQRTLVNTDIIGVQPSDGAAWYKTTLAKLSEFLYISIYSVAKTWSALQTFAAGIDIDQNKITNVADGSSQYDAVNFGQLETKQSVITGTTGKFIKKTSGGVSTASFIGESATLRAINIAELGAAPSSSADSIGAVGDIGWYGDYVYLKTNSGWLISNRFNTF